MRHEYDCVVVGAGMVGAVCALLLAARGQRVAVLDNRPSSYGRQPPADPRGLALAPSSRHILEAIGLWECLRPRIAPIERIHISDRGHFGCTRFDCADTTLPALGYVCPADVLAGVLDVALEAAASCTAFWSAELRGIETGATGVAVRFGAAAAEHGIRAPLIVGADGVRSLVRRHANIGVDTRDYGQTAIVASVVPEKPRPGTAFERFTPDGPVALLPSTDGRWYSVCVAPTGNHQALLDLPPAAYLEHLAAVMGHRLGRFTDLGRRHAHRLTLSRAHGLVAARCALVGSAANSIHPNAAQGLNLGLRDAAQLAEVVLDAAQAGEDIGGSACLARYAAARTREQNRVVAFTDLLARGFTSQLPALVLGRSFALLAVDLIPPLKRGFIRRATGLAGRQPRLLAS